MNSQEINLQQLDKIARVNRQVVNRLKQRVSVLENALELVCDDPQMLWLYRNRSERMDPTVPIFDEQRARFHLARYEFACQYVAEKRVADIACGTGYGCQILMEQGKCQSVIGVDACRQAIDYALQKHLVENVEYLCADAAATELNDESVDCLVSFETIEHVPDDQSLIAQFARILGPQGLLICSTPNMWPLEIAQHHVREYDREKFVDCLEQHFLIDKLFNQNSGSDFRFNRDQPAGITPTNEQNHQLAECFIAVARRK